MNIIYIFHDKKIYFGQLKNNKKDGWIWRFFINDRIFIGSYKIYGFGLFYQKNENKLFIMIWKIGKNVFGKIMTKHTIKYV